MVNDYAHVANLTDQVQEMLESKGES